VHTPQPAEAKEQRSGVTYRNLSITEIHLYAGSIRSQEAFNVLHTPIPRWRVWVVGTDAL